MTSYRHGQHDGADAGGEGLPGARPSDLYPPGFWGPSGGEGGGAAPRLPAPTPAMPKMGVRARIADWPPKRDAPRDPTAPSPSRDSESGGSLDFPSPRGVPNGQPAPAACLRAAPRFSRRRSKDVEFPEGWPRSPGRGWTPLRHRSSSEVTLSECEVAEEAPALGARVANGLPLFREYGSTSSINAQGLSEQSFVAVLRDLRSAPAPGDPSRDGAAKEKPRKKAPKGADAGGDSIFRKLRSGRSEPGPEPAEDGRAGEGGRAWLCPKGFAHYDAQSLLFDLRAAAASRAQPGQRRNTTTGASAASADAAGPEELNGKESLEHDPGDATSNDLLLSCPHFRNEIGGLSERNLSFARGGAAAGVPEGPEPPLSARCTNAGVSVLEVPPEQQRDPGRLQRYSIEHVDLGAHYYRDYFHGKEHSNYFGVDEKLGPVAVSIRRERLEDHKEHGPQYQYRLIFRTSELATLRGSIPEDAIPTTTKPGTGRGLPLKDALEYVVPELNIHCLRLALTAAPAKVTEQLLKLDEQGICRKHKVGILYCKAGQSSEEEMYNNEAAGPAFEEFLELLGDRVCLRSFSKYAAQLDTKTDSTGTHSLYTTYQDYEIMFHVSTMLPYTPNNRQQLLRKRHIGNDIVTIVFQEPGALPFTPQSVRSHFQHVFIVVRAHSPCTDSVCYSVAVTRSKDVPPFGPPIPRGATFRRSELFRDFLLAKAVNAEHAAHKSAKFKAMATRTRQEYLRDLAERCGTGPPLDAAGKFSLMALASKRREKARARAGAELLSAGALAWHVRARDFGRSAEVDCALAVSSELMALLDLAAKEVAFHCFCADVIGWTADAATLKVFYGRGDHVLLRAPDESPGDIQEIVQRLKIVTSGCETVDMTLRRNGLGQLGFHVRYDGTVAEVEEYGFAWQAGLRQGSRLVEICKVAVVTLSHDQMIDLLRTSVTVKVVIVPPHEDGTPRRGWAESLEAQGTEPKAEPESAPTGYRPPYRSHSAWQWNGPASHNPGGRWSEALPLGHGQSLSRPPKQAPAAVPYRDPQPPHGKRPVSFPETPHLASPAGTERPQPYRQPSGSFSAPGSSGAIFTRYKPSPERYAAASPRSLLPFEPPNYGPDAGSSGDSSSGGLASQDSTMERHKPEPLWHVPAPARLPAATAGLAKRPSRQELAGKDSPNRPPKGEAQYSSHSSSNTLSSNASSSHSDEPWFDAPDPAEPEPDPASVGGSSDSGIDTALYTSSPGARPTRPTPAHAAGLPDNGKRREPVPAGQSWGYRHKGYAGSAESYKPPGTRQGYPVPGYKAPAAETPRPTHGPQPGSFPLSASVPKSFFSKQAARAKHSAGWRRLDEPPARPPEPKRQVDASARNVFGQPRLRASLRDLRSPRKSPKSSIEDDLKKLIIMDAVSPEPDCDGVSPKMLQRTLSDESLCSGRRDPSYAAAPTCFDLVLASDVLSGSTFPSSTLPVRRQPGPGPSLPEKKSAISASELSLVDTRDKPVRRLDPGLMPLPDTAAGLEWSSLVNAAKAYEVQRAVSLFCLHQPGRGPDVPPAPGPAPRPTMSEEPSVDLPGKVCQLEAMLKQLHNDLQKEKQDKVVLQAEVATLRQNNQRLQEESQTATAQLRRFAEIFSGAADTKEP